MNRSVVVIIALMAAGLVWVRVQPAVPARPLREAKVIERACRNDKRQYGPTVCYFLKFKHLGQRRGLDYSFQVLTALETLDPATKQCHLLAHGIGYGLFERDPNGWRRLVTDVSHEGCREGVIHALVERGVSQQGGELTPKTIARICGSEPAMWCIHSIGHAVVINTRTDVPKALQVCDGLPGIFQQFLCSEGVFMEYSTATGLAAHSIVPPDWLEWKRRLPELVAQCNRYDGTKHTACWEELAHVALEVNNNRLLSVYRFCEQSNTAEGTWLCKSHATGIMLISMEQNKTLDMKREFCRHAFSGAEGDAQTCHSVIMETYLYDHPDKTADAAGYCGSLEYGSQKTCYATVGRMRNRRSGRPDPSSCAKAPEEFRLLCNGAGVTAAHFPWEP